MRRSARVGLLGLRDHEQPRRVAVEAVDDARRARGPAPPAARPRSASARVVPRVPGRGVRRRARRACPPRSGRRPRRRPRRSAAAGARRGRLRGALRRATDLARREPVALRPRARRRRSPRRRRSGAARPRASRAAPRPPGRRPGGRRRPPVPRSARTRSVAAPSRPRRAAASTPTTMQLSATLNAGQRDRVDEVDHGALARPVDQVARARRRRSIPTGSHSSGTSPVDHEVGDQQREREADQHRHDQPAALQRAERHARVAHVAQVEARERRRRGRPGRCASSTSDLVTWSRATTTPAVASARAAGPRPCSAVG